MSHHHEVQSGQPYNQKTIQAYLLGFFLSILLTLVAFGLVVKQVLAGTSLYFSLGLLAVAQLIVQSICFLRLNSSAEGRWNLLPFLFTIFIILIFISGTLWIINSLNYNMMH